MSVKAAYVRIAAVLLVCFAAHAQTPTASPQPLDPQTQQLSRDILQQLIEINTTDSVGNVTTAADAMAKRLRDAGFPESDVQVLGPNERKKNMVARLHGTGAKKPILLIGHLDVVEARREDWTTDPFQFVEKDGYFYGRGTQDMKSEDAAMVTTFIRLKQEGYKPDRDIILALTADEEGGNFNGPDWLLKNHRDLIDAEFVINGDGGGPETEKGKPVIYSVDAAEKLYADYLLEVTNPGGHSSLPVPDNAIYHLADGIVRIQNYQFPFELSDVTRAYFEQMAKLKTGQTGSDMNAILKTPPDQAAIARLSRDALYNSTMRTTCVATRLQAGHANNALPQRATANVNCRIFPGHSREEIRQDLIKVVADPKISVQLNPNSALGVAGSQEGKVKPVPLMAGVMDPLKKVVNQMWPGIPIVPTMATGASDGVYTNAAGLPTYGISGVAVDIDDVRAHGRDERIRVSAYYTGVEFTYQYVKALTGGRYGSRCYQTKALQDEKFSTCGAE